MTLANTIPEIWGAALAARWTETKAYWKLFNRDYDGDISAAGDQVHIQKRQAITISDVPATNIPVQDYAYDTTLLLINKQKMFAAQIQDKDAIQADRVADLDIVAEAVIGFDQQLNTDLLTEALAGRPTANIIDAGATLDHEDFADARRLFELKDVPPEDNFAIVHPDQISNMRKDDAFRKADEYGSNVILVTGEIGMVHGFRIIVSNRVQTLTAPTPDDRRAVFIHRDAISIAMQKMPTVESVRPDLNFKTILKGFNLYGLKTINADGIVEINSNII